MYEFATIALLGLAVAKLVDLVYHLASPSRAAKVTLALLFGVLVTWATDYSAFAGWGIQFRALWMGTVGTGLVIGGTAAVWHEILDALSSYARRSHEEVAGPESRTPARVA
jgi:hypothetical protein